MAGMTDDLEKQSRAALELGDSHLAALLMISAQLSRLNDNLEDVIPEFEGPPAIRIRNSG